MAFAYLTLNIIFMICVIALIVKKFSKPPRAWWITLLGLLLLTLIFDNLIIWAGIVGYDTSKILGVFIGYAPVEDFFYAVLACVIVPVFWHQFDPACKKEPAQ